MALTADIETEDAASLLGKLFDLERSALQNPYPIYAAVREQAPVLRIGPMVSVSRYEDIKDVLRDAETFTSVRSRGSSVKARLEQLGPDQAVQLKNLLIAENRQIPQSDDPVHARLRRFVNQTFSAKRIGAMREDLFDIANELLDDVEARGEGRFDLIGDFSFHLPFRAICSILGVPKSKAEDLRAWGEAITQGIGTGYSNVEEAYAALCNFEEYVGGLIEHARNNPGGTDLISELVVTDDEGSYLSNEDLVAIFVQMLVSGNTNTLIANAMVALQRNPDQLDLLRKNPSLIRGSVDEFLRYCPSIHAIHRTATRDCEIAGFPVHKGESVRLLLASANHDPDKFEDPETLDVTRKNARQHLGLGFGIHTCLGQWLARLDTEVALTVLLERYPKIALDGPVVNRATFTMHGPEQLYVTT